MTAIECQNLVIGSGEGGKFLAWNLATAGESTIVVERALVGGSCPNVACLPSKNVLYSAEGWASPPVPSASIRPECCAASAG
jgi:pyruvate/2-oxoglutarate dehydrogenase complex dihydrolipoamide dehydrogenase (E3) component